jgi:hypothetical protein
MGQFLIQEVIVKQANAAKAEANNLLTNLDVLKIIGQLHSLTAYGTDFEPGPKFDGVLLLQVEPETRKILEGMAAGMLLQDNGMLKKTNEEGNVMYSLGDQLYASPQEKGLIMFSKSKASIKQATELAAGHGKNLKQSKAFSSFPPVNDGFILLAVAEGFQENLPIPPEAKVLKQADGARVVIGEKAGKAFVNLGLKAKDAEVSKQIQMVVEGIVALGSLSQSENKELQELIQSIKVVSDEKTVSVTAAYPVDSLIGQASKMLAEEEKPKHKHKRKEKHEESKDEKPEASASDSK